MAIGNCPECEKPMATNTCTCGYSVPRGGKGGSPNDPNRFRCDADDCPCTGGGSPSVCHFHYGLQQDLWPAMTARLRECDWLLRLCRWVRDNDPSYSHPDMRQRIPKWRGMSDHPELTPQAGESPKAWIYRAHGWIKSPISKQAQQRWQEKQAKLFERCETTEA